MNFVNIARLLSVFKRRAGFLFIDDTNRRTYMHQYVVAQLGVGHHAQVDRALNAAKIDFPFAKSRNIRLRRY